MYHSASLNPHSYVAGRQAKGPQSLPVSTATDADLISSLQQHNLVKAGEAIPLQTLDNMLTGLEDLFPN